MNRLSAIDSLAPAFSRVSSLLFQRFRLALWLKIGFIGLLGGGVVTAGGTGNSFRSSDVPLGQLPPEAGHWNRALHSIHISNYAHLILFGIAAIAVIVLIFQYLFCRFRFILFDTVVYGQPEIKRGWNRYESQANRYFGFWIVYRLVNWAVMIVIVGVPLWRAYKNGVFSGDNSVEALIAALAPLALGLIVASIIFGVISTLMKDFVLPVLALDDFTLGDAFAAVWRVVVAEPGAWIIYMVLKVVCAVGSAIAVTIVFLVLMIPTGIAVAIPAAILIGLGVLIIHAGIYFLGILVCVLGGLLVASIFCCLLLVVTAPVSVFFASYAFYFFGGRYPKLAALLWPATSAPAPVMGTQPAQ
jgi:hypothetical protein